MPHQSHSIRLACGPAGLKAAGCPWQPVTRVTADIARLRPTARVRLTAASPAGRQLRLWGPAQAWTAPKVSPACGRCARELLHWPTDRYGSGHTPQFPKLGI